MQRDWFMYHLRSNYKNRLEFPFKSFISESWEKGNTHRAGEFLEEFPEASRLGVILSWAGLTGI